MRTFVVYVLILSTLLAGAVALVYVNLVESGDPGYAIIGHGQWAVESTLLTLLGILLGLFLLLHVTLRLLGTMVSLPKSLKRRSEQKRNQRSQEALLVGLYESAQGNWEKAEKTLVRHAANSGAPLIHYLTAARAAQSRGARELRDEYLRVAAETMPEAELAIGLTRAELQLSERQFDHALENLSQLNKIAPTHAAVLKMLHRTYAHLEDWEALHALLPKLSANKVMMEAEIKLLETETYSALLKQKAQLKDAAVLKELWKHVPKHIRAVSGVQALYFAAMIEAGAGADIEGDVREALGKAWDQTLLVLYGCIEQRGDAASAQVRFLEGLLSKYPEDAVLLRVLGRICYRSRLLDLAEQYLARSLAVEASVEAYHLMGELLAQRGDKAAASDYYRKGLLLASSEVVQQVEEHAEEASPVAEEPSSESGAAASPADTSEPPAEG
ncbi:heme biosynthesis protein HemY [Methylogaea oryzae]|uniref:Heme biosynthesis protein HemY n=1 Tax=Methylogaea oryzae TaxID=1295382 RepID=A0A8D5ALP9_9GAMM|nr:heme biosynthesis HemY N-terminal domain-containing protein [Methylogaea oryzae]BBL72361.1 heme biosynthesis protein HemY [Methylogaea oryzae]